MGVPKFYRWVSERYPLVNQPCGLVGAPGCDNFYLDLNGVVHNCSHGSQAEGESSAPSSAASGEALVMSKIMSYLDTIVSVVRPRQLIYLAIDGCAPRAKMNQQRARRFRTAIEAAKAAEEDKRKNGGVEPEPGSRFDSNCITPGTAFMQVLTRHLKAHIARSLETGAWGNVEVILNGHEVPGEGEHKIMEYIRAERSHSNYAPNIRHCMYGLDADLIMLALTTHEPHFMLLREVVSFTGGNGGKPPREVLENPSEDTFMLLQIGLLRDYLTEEYTQGFLAAQAADAASKAAAAGGEVADSRADLVVDEERIIDDFVFLCMLVGNDFLPPLPTLDINEGALDDIFRMYKEFVPRHRAADGTGAWLVAEGGVLNLARFELFATPLAEAEAAVLRNRARDAEKFEERKNRGNSSSARDALAELGMLPAQQGRRLVPAGDGWTTVKGGDDDGDDSGGEEEAKAAAVEAALAARDAAPPATASAPTMMTAAMRRLLLSDDPTGYDAWKDRHYRDKLHRPTEDGRREVVHDYIEGLQWVLYYYKCGVASWSWYYPHHYSPLASDLKMLDALPRYNGADADVLPSGLETFKYSIGAAFLPYQQLMAVLPAASQQLMPEPYRHLMTSPDSPILDFYPTDVEVDFEGKRAEWEGVVLLPFIDPQRLVQSMDQNVRTATLTHDEKIRNTHGLIASYRHPSGGSLSVREYKEHQGAVGVKPCLASRLIGGTVTGASNPVGWPTLKTLHHTGALSRAGVDVFQCGMTSKRDSYVVRLRDLRVAEHIVTADQVAGVILGTRIHVNWPYLREAMVVEVCDASGRLQTKGGDGERVKVDHPKEKSAKTGNAAPWPELVREVKGLAIKHRGIDVGEVDVLLGVSVCTGTTRSLLGYIEKEWSSEVNYVPLQASLRRDPSLVAATAAGKEVEQVDADGEKGAYARESRCLFLGQTYFGCVAEVAKATDARLDIGVEVPPAALRASQLALSRLVKPVASSQRYMPAGQACKKVGLSPRGFGCITSSMQIDVSDQLEGAAAEKAAKEAEQRGELPPEDVAGDGPRKIVDVGLNFKMVRQGEVRCVPDFAMPMESNFAPNADGSRPSPSFAYSDDAVAIIVDYLQKFPFIKAFAEMDRKSRVMDCEAGFGASGALGVQADAMPREDTVRHVTSAAAFLKSHACMRRAMVRPTNSLCAASDGIARLEEVSASVCGSNGSAMAGWSVVDLENVPRPLLLPPMKPGVRSDAYLSRQSYELGDRVNSCLAQGANTPPFGASGTIVGIHGLDKFSTSGNSKDLALEVLFDQPFKGGATLGGRVNGKKGALLRGDCVLNVSRKVQGGGSATQGQGVDQVLANASRGVRTTGTRAYASALQEAPAPMPEQPPPMPNMGWLNAPQAGKGRAASGPLGRAAAANASAPGAVQQPPPANSGKTLMNMLKSSTQQRQPPPPAAGADSGKALLGALKAGQAQPRPPMPPFAIASPPGGAVQQPPPANSGKALMNMLKSSKQQRQPPPPPAGADSGKALLGALKAGQAQPQPAQSPVISYEAAAVEAAEAVEKATAKALEGGDNSTSENPELAFWQSLKNVYQEAGGE